MSDTLKTLKSLRQSRQFDGHSIPVEDVQTILEIARWTGSARNIQPWQLIVVQEKAALQALAEVPSLRLVRGQVLDMFPHTAHYEVLTLLERA